MSRTVPSLGFWSSLSVRDITKPGTTSYNLVWLSAIIIGCFLNGTVLELIIKEDKGAGGLMTLCQFSFVALLLVPKYIKFNIGEAKSFINLKHKTPFKEYWIMTAVFFVTSVSSNYAFVLGVSQPFAVIFRSLSLLISFLVGLYWFNKSYSWRAFVAVGSVTLGVMVTTMGEVYLKSDLPIKLNLCCSEYSYWSQLVTVLTNDPVLYGNSPTQSVISDSATFLQDVLVLAIATSLLGFTLVGLAVLGHLQGETYKNYRSDPEENMFYVHTLPIPFFLIFIADLVHHWNLWTNSENYTLFGFISLPWMWWLCIANIATQYVCVKGVHNVTASMGTLTCTFTTTVRKFLSLLFSVLYFRNPFTAIHFVGAAMVFIGTYLFATSTVTDASLANNDTKKNQ